MKRLFCSLLFPLIITSVAAQDIRLNPDPLSRWSVGLEAGVSKNYLVTDISGFQFSKLTPRKGYFAAIPVLFRVNSWLSLYSDPGIIQKNYEFQRTGDYAGAYILTNNQYVQVPLMLRFNKAFKRFSFYVQAGGYGAWWLSGHSKGSLLNILDPSVTNGATGTTVNFYGFDERYHFNSIRDNRIEFGWMASGGIVYRVGQFQVFIDARNAKSLTDQQKHYQTAQISKHNATYSLSVGTLVNIATITSGIHRKGK